MKIVLCGYMGSGKTSVGKLIANLLHKDFVDLDEVITAHEGMDVSEIFKKKGEIYFRKLENKALQEVFLAPKEQVISLGGGTPCYGNNLDLIKNADTVLIYLKMDVKALTNRLFEEKETRPMISHYAKKENLEDFIRKHLFERGYFYHQSDVIINVEGKSPEGLAKEIVEALN